MRAYSDNGRARGGVRCFFRRDSRAPRRRISVVWPKRRCVCVRDTPRENGRWTTAERARVRWTDARQSADGDARNRLNPPARHRHFSARTRIGVVAKTSRKQIGKQSRMEMENRVKIRSVRSCSGTMITLRATQSRFSR